MVEQWTMIIFENDSKICLNNIDQFLFFWTHVDTSSAANAHRGPTLLAHGRVEVGHDVGAAW